MAMQSTLASCSLRMTDNYGVVDGKEVVKTHTYNKIRTSAADSEIFALAQAIDSLTQPTTDAVYAVRVSALTES